MVNFTKSPAVATVTHAPIPVGTTWTPEPIARHAATEPVTTAIFKDLWADDSDRTTRNTTHLYR